MRMILTTLLLAWPLFSSETEVADSTKTVVPNDTSSMVTITLPQTEESSIPHNSAFIENSTFEKLSLGGSFQFKAYHHDITNPKDSAKELSFSLSKFRLDLEGAYNENIGIMGQFLVEANGQKLGIEIANVYYKKGFTQFKAGKLKKPFSMEALQSSTVLNTVDRGRLYNVFLNEETGYSGLDVGVTVRGGFEDAGTEVTYEAGVFNGKQSKAGYSGAQYQGKDDGFKAKDIAARLQLKGFGGLELDVAFSTKTYDHYLNAATSDLVANAAYEAGLAYHLKGFRFQGEIATGANHKGNDSLIASGSAEFLAFYGMLLYHQDYSGKRASETLIKLEGLDPDMTIGSGGGKKNDGKFRYTAGINYFFTPKISVLTNYGLTQPFTKEIGAGHFVQDIDVLARLNF